MKIVLGFYVFKYAFLFLPKIITIYIICRNDIKQNCNIINNNNKVIQYTNNKSRKQFYIFVDYQLENFTIFITEY